MKIFAHAITFVSLMTITYQAVAVDLNELLPGLYGGDGVTISPAPNPLVTDHSAHFIADSNNAVTELNDQLAREVGTLPIGTSSPGGIAYKFDPDTGTYNMISKDLGPVLARGSRTLGKGN